jgi:hypothetical protein
VEPWREDLCFGAVRAEGGIRVSLRSGEPWKGKLIFDKPRHRLHMHLPMDYPRINQFPEWFTVAAGKEYAVTDFGTGSRTTARGDDLQRGLPLELRPGEELRPLAAVPRIAFLALRGALCENAARPGGLWARPRGI